jgi:hypothetical protein
MSNQPAFWTSGIFIFGLNFERTRRKVFK